MIKGGRGPRGPGAPRPPPPPHGRRVDAVRWLWVLLAMALLNAQVSGDIAGNRDIWLWAGMITGLAIGARSEMQRPPAGDVAVR